MGRKQSWLDGEIHEELAALDMDARLPEAEELLEPQGMFERFLGIANGDEKRYFVLWALYATAQGDAAEKGDVSQAMFCGVRAEMIQNIFYFRVAERLGVWDIGAVELGVRKGWTIVGMTPEDKRKINAAGDFFSSVKDDGQVT